MDITATLNEIEALSIEDRINLVQAIWDGIAEDRACADLTDMQKQELDRRIVTAVVHSRRSPKAWQKRI
jgi:putative addiction module component (TIGR02574 family)